MGSEDWYRNSHWDPEIEAAFNTKLARSRSQKAQYLRIQGSILKDSHPETAIDLLARCIDEGEPFYIAHALLDMAHAHHVLGETDRALERLEAVMEQQRREPMVRTSAEYDYAFLVALHERTELYEKALAALDRAPDPLFPVMVFEEQAARAVIHAWRGEIELARSFAWAALAAKTVRASWVPGHFDVGIVPDGDDPFSRRLVAITEARSH